MRYLISVLLSALAFSAGARVVMPEEAAAVAEEILQSSHNLNAPKLMQADADGGNAAEAAPFYVFNAADGGGFVIVSGDDRLPKVLAYSHSGNADPENIPPQLRDGIDAYRNSLRCLRADAPVHPSWAAKEERQAQVVVAPMIENVKWHQGFPFNDMCPTIDDTPVSVGCVGTAMAMILYYHKWPERSHGHHSYEWSQDGGATEEISIDYGENPYDWANMLDDYGRETTEAQRRAVAELCRDCAYASHADFTNWSTGGSTFYVYTSLIHHFNYDTAIRWATCTSHSYADLCGILKSELDEKRPMLYYSGCTPAGIGAHAYVCDGYDSDDYFHFNFGWSGSWNGFYSVEMSGLLGDAQGVFYGIQKHRQDADVLSLLGGGVDFACAGGNKVSCEITHLSGWRSHEMNEGYAVENTLTGKVEYYVTDTFDWQESRGVTSSMTINRTPAADGDYIVYPVARFADGDWQKYPFSDNWQSYVCLTVKGGKATLSDPDIEFPLDPGRVEINGIYYILDDSNNTAAVTFRNRRYDSYKGKVVIPETVSYGGKDYIVDRVGEKAFYYCKHLTEITLPNSVEVIEQVAFESPFSKLRQVNIGKDSKLREIGLGAFSGTELTSFYFPESLETIGMSAFGFHKMQNIYLPKSVRSLGYQAFSTWGQTQKENIYVKWTDAAEMSDINWYAFDETNTSEMWRPVRTLYVPLGCKAMYESLIPAGMIDHIKEYDVNGIEDIVADSDCAVEYYNMQGQRLDMAEENLPAGIYIRRQGRTSGKVIIR